MEKNDINCKTRNNENEKMKCEFLDAISQMLIYYKNREKSDNEYKSVSIF